MESRLLLLFGLTFLASLALVQCVGPQQGSGEAQIGQPAPTFQLEDLEGNQIALEQYRGKIVMLDFWATWCGPCRQSMPVLEELQARYSDDLVLLAINLEESREQVRSFAAQENIRSKVLLDEQGEVGRAYRSMSIPMQVLIDPDGIVRYIQIGFGSSTGDILREEIGKILG